MVTVPRELPVTATEQLVPESMQVPDEGNETPPIPPVSEKVMVSPEIFPAAPETLAVH
jgi:hypothetical protein